MVGWKTTEKPEVIVLDGVDFVETRGDGMKRVAASARDMPKFYRTLLYAPSVSFYIPLPTFELSTITDHYGR